MPAPVPSQPLYIRIPYKRYLARLVTAVLQVFAHVIRRVPATDMSHVALDRIAVLRLDHLGDVVMSTPVYGALRQRFPAARLTVVVGPWARDVVALNRHLDEVIEFAAPWWANRRGGLPVYRRLWAWACFPHDLVRLLRRLRAERYDLMIDLRGDLRHIAGILALSGSRFRLSFARTGGEELLTHAVPFAPHAHEIRKNLALLDPLGIRTVPSRTALWIDGPSERGAKQLLERVGISTHDAFAVLHPGAQAVVRRWPFERFAAVGEWLIATYGVKVVVVGGSDEVALAAALRQCMKSPPAVLCGSTTVLELAAILKAARVFVGNDSGPMHLAAAMGTPIVAVFGPNDPDLCGPLISQAHVLFQRFECCPCIQHGCSLWRKPWGQCVDALSISTVQNAIAQLLRDR